MAKKKKDIKISFIDEPASEDVTGSGVYIETPNHKILLDYGLAQSNDKYEDFLVNNRKTKEFKIKELDTVFISHLHADHCLAVPKLYKYGFRGTTIVPSGNLGIYKTMTIDSAYIAERDILVINSQHNKKYEPLYSVNDVKTMLAHILEKSINEKIYVDDELSFEFVPSGHLLYGCQIILYITIDGLTKTILYTGDIGNSKIENRFVGKFKPVNKADLVIGESTYGDRPDLKTGNKERKNDLNKLQSIIDIQVKEMHGRVIIPSFAQSRIQQLAYMIYSLYKDNEWQPKVYIDSPLAIEIFKDYEKVLEDDKDIFDELLKWDNLIFVKESEESKLLVSSNEPCVILSTAGMCNVGRVRHHLKSVIPNPNATVLFVGFSTEGSLASLLKDNKVQSVTIDNKEYKCRCASYSLKSMSGHAPFKQLVDYYSSINCNGRIILHHGSAKAKENLAEALREELAKKSKTTRVVIANSSLKFKL